MSSPVFEWAAEQVELLSGLSRTQARGTLRLVLQQAGVSPTAVRRGPMAVLVRRALSIELQNRGVASAPEVCEELARRLSVTTFDDEPPR